MSAEGLLSVEALLALTLLGLILPPAFCLLHDGADRLRRAVAHDRFDGGVMAALERLGRDARCACVSTDGDGPFVGRRVNGFSSLEFTTAAGNGELVQKRVRYYVGRAGDGEPDLRRTDGGREAVLLDRISRFDVRYFNGDTWTDDWGWNPTTGRPSLGIRGLPVAVEVRIAVRSEAGVREALERIPVMTVLLNRTLHG